MMASFDKGVSSPVIVIILAISERAAAVRECHFEHIRQVAPSRFFTAVRNWHSKHFRQALLRASSRPPVS